MTLEAAEDIDEKGWQYFRDELYLTEKDTWNDSDAFFEWYMDKDKKNFEYKDLTYAQSLITEKNYMVGFRRKRGWWIKEVIDNNNKKEKTNAR